jgi:hypothetical protein
MDSMHTAIMVNSYFALTLHVNFNFHFDGISVLVSPALWTTSSWTQTRASCTPVSWWSMVACQIAYSTAGTW